MSDTPPTTPDRGSMRRRAGRWIVMVFLVGGLVLWAQLSPVEVVVGFDVPPAVRADQGAGFERSELRGLAARFHDSSGAEVAAASVDMPAGLEGPVTPPIVLRLPRGTYRADVVLTARDGRRATRQVLVRLEDEGYTRVDLDPRYAAGTSSED